MLRKIGKGGQAASGRGLTPLSIIGADVRIVGDIITQGEMQIDGQIEGDITCHRLVVGEGARITGEVTADSVRIHGQMNGRIIAGSVTIAKSAQVFGDITHETLEIEAGGHLEGHLIRKGSQPATATPALEPPRAAHADSELAEAAQ
ncbi:MAG TPA: polymer-forming cytoskeletal protein [Magnetospirillum sp.]|nr:polymer-forming cytoskeletal protein [Magnetospirillum sp.]